MSHSLPVVASEWRGPQDIVIVGETGVLCPPYDPSAFAREIRRLATDADLRAEMGKAGRAVCSAKYSLDTFLRGLENVFIQADCRLKPDWQRDSSPELIRIHDVKL